MKRNNIIKVITLITVFSLNIHWFNTKSDETFVDVASAMRNIDEQIDGGGGGWDGGGDDGKGYDFLKEVEVEREDVTGVTDTVPNPPSGNDLSCPWECGETYWYPDGYVAIPEMCTEGNEMVYAIRADINNGTTGDWDGDGDWGADSVYNAGENVSWDGLWVWKKYNVTTGIGWTAWWVALANYCEAAGYWSGSNKQEIEYGDTATLTFTIAENVAAGGTYGVNLLAKTVDTIRMQGNYTGGKSSAQTVTTPNFNSPFIYFDTPDGAYTVSLDSQWDRYISVMPRFTTDATWNVVVNQGKINVEDTQHDHLFYELAMHRVDLTRRGVNFASKAELIQFLTESDFFANLHMKDVEKQNSLGYLLPQLPDAKNYYLTILADKSVAELSTLTISPTPEQVVRTYYAVYPTPTAVSTEGGLVYPKKFDDTKSTVKEYGEIIVKPEMYVFWK